MKARLLSIVIATACFCITACKNHQTDEPNTDRVVYLADSAYLYSVDADSMETLTQLTYFTYDANGNMTLQFDSVLVLSSPYSASKRKIEMEYDGKGNMVVQQRSAYQPLHDLWDIGRRLVYEYDVENKLSVETIFETYSGPLEKPSKKLYYTWIDDTHASCLGYMYYYAKEPWTLTERIEYTYNSYGKVVKAVSYGLIGGETMEGHLWGTSTYEYDQFGNLILFIYYDQNNVIHTCEYYKYEYDANGKMLVKWYGNETSQVENRTYSEKCVYFY